MSIFRNIKKAVFEFGKYGDFLKHRKRYCLFYIFILSIFLTAAQTHTLFYRYYVDVGGASGAVKKIVPEFKITKRNGLEVKDVIKKSIIFRTGTTEVNFIEYIIDTTENDVEFTRKWFQDKYNYNNKNEALFIYITSKNTYIIYPGALDKDKNTMGIAVYSNYNLLMEFGIGSNNESYIFEEIADAFFYGIIIAVWILSFIVLIGLVFYFSFMVIVFMRLFSYKKMKFGNAFKICSFAFTGAVLFEFVVSIVNFIINCIINSESFVFQTPPFMMVVIFIMYIVAVIKKSDIPAEKIEVNADN